jgi:hypothetical protein
MQRRAAPTIWVRQDALHLAARGKEDRIEERDRCERRGHPPKQAPDAVMRQRLHDSSACS